jgi:protein-histidine pros-kinase
MQGILNWLSALAGPRQVEHHRCERTVQLEAVTARLADLAGMFDKTHAIVQDLDGTILHWNSGAASVYGWSREEALGRKSFELLHTELPQPFDEIQAALLKNSRWTGEFKQRCHDGSVIWETGHWDLHRDAAGHPVSVVKVNSDITELKRIGDALRASQATARSLFENAGQAILTADRDGRIVDANAMTEALFGYSKDELIGALVETLMPERLRKGHVDRRADYARQTEPRALGDGPEMTARRQDGSEFPVEINLSYVAQQSGGLVMAFISDITARKEASRALLAKNLDLARALDAAREASEHKSRFMTNMSHELRTPLNSIIGFTEILSDKRAGDINEIQQEFLDDSLRSARQLLALINDLLDMERIASGRTDLCLERFDLHKLVREAAQEVGVTPPAVGKRIVLEPDDSVQWVCLDCRKTKQILLNLLTNAVKFTAEGGLVTVRVRAEGVDRWRLEVEDTGIGISERDQKRLFQEFERLESALSKSFPGTGLGLALTKSLVEAQGGTLAVSSHPGVGSTFFAILPLQLERRAQPPVA